LRRWWNLSTPRSQRVNPVTGAALKVTLVPKISKTLVAYMEGLLAVSPNVNGPFDTCAKARGVVEAAAK
jgi:hypothetical protein